MELLLNLLWIAMAVAVLSAFVQRRCGSSRVAQTPYVTALIALACLLALLFPVVSASDDLHPTQAVLEGVTKRLQQAVAPFQHAHAGLFMATLPSLLAVSLMFALAGSQFWRPVTCEARVIHREQTPRNGRAPPSF
jgi:cbb3-type cytochrome oxidase subunit 1